MYNLIKCDIFATYSFGTIILGKPQFNFSKLPLPTLIVSKKMQPPQSGNNSKDSFTLGCTSFSLNLTTTNISFNPTRFKVIVWFPYNISFFTLWIIVGVIVKTEAEFCYEGQI